MVPQFRFALTLLCLLLGSQPIAASTPRPRLLFTPDDVPALRSKMHDGGDDDHAYRELLRRWTIYQNAPDEALLDAWMEGSNIVSELGLMAHVEVPGTAQAQRARRLVLHVARTRQVNTDEFRSSLRLRTLAFGYDMIFATAPAAEQAELRSEIQAYLAFMPTHWNYYRYLHNPFTSNKGMTIGASMGLAVIAIWDDVTPAERPALAVALGFADALVRKCNDDLLASDGAYREGVLYGAWTMRMGIPYFEARRRFDGVDLAADPRFERMAEWLAYEVLPEGGGRTNNLNDSPWITHPLSANSTYLAWAQSRFNSSLSRWLYRHVVGVFGWDAPNVNADRMATALWGQRLPHVNPGTLLPDSRLFDQRGLYFYRSGWKNNARGKEILFSFQAGRFMGGHAQEDQGQFTLYAHGDRYALDNGSAYPTALPKETASHNLVLIDERGQHNAGASVGTDARITNALVTPFADYLRADLKPAYDTHSPFNDPDVPFPGTDWSWGYDGGNPVWRADRTIAVVKGEEAPTWFLVTDDIQKDGSSHTYDWLLHTDTGNTVDASTDPITIRGTSSRMLVYFAHPRPPQLSVTSAPYSNGGEDPSTQRLVARVQSVEPRFVTALIPLADDVESPSTSAVQIGRATQLHLGWGDVEDVAVFNPTESLFAGEIRTDGRMAVVRHTNGAVGRYLLAEGSTLRWRGLDLVVLTGGDANAALSGTTLHLSRQDLDFVAYGPQVNRVSGPFGDVPFFRDGPWVRNAVVVGTHAEPRATPGHLQTIPIHCSLGPQATVHATIHDVRGRLLRTLGSESLDGTRGALVWDRRNERAERVAAGIYFVRLDACGRTERHRLVLVR